MHICKYVFVYKELQSVDWQGRRHMWVRTTWVHNIIYVYFEKTYIYIFIYLYANREVLSVSSRKGTDRCELHNLGSYTRVSIIWYMYTCEDMHVYKKVLSARTRKGTNICKFAQHRFIYKRIDDRKYVHFEKYWCIQRAYVNLHIMGSYTYTRIYAMTYVYIYIYLYLQICACIQRASKCALARADTYVNSQNLSSYTKVSIIRYMYLCEYYNQCIQRCSKCERSTGCEHMPCQNKTLSRTCKQEMAAYNRTCTPQVQIWGSKCEGSRGHTHTYLSSYNLGSYTKVPFKIIHGDTCILMNICMRTKRF